MTICWKEFFSHCLHLSFNKHSKLCCLSAAVHLLSFCSSSPIIFLQQFLMLSFCSCSLCCLSSGFHYVVLLQKFHLFSFCNSSICCLSACIVFIYDFKNNLGPMHVSLHTLFKSVLDNVQYFYLLIFGEPIEAIEIA